MKLVYATAVAALIASSMSLSAQAQPRRDGNWEVTVQMEMAGMPQGMTLPPMKMTQCVTPQEAADPQKLVPQQASNSDCKVSDYKMEGNKASWKMACTTPQAMTGDGEFVYSDDSYTGTMRMTTSRNGQPMNMNMKYSAKRLGDCTK